MNEWQPIETAPKDAANDVLIFDGSVLIGRWFRYNGLAAWRDWDADVIEDATHWMPLPPAPDKRILNE